MSDYKYSWEEAIAILRKDPEHQQLIFDSYLTTDLLDNCKRFYNSEEFTETIRVIKKYKPNAITILDMPAGNGIASYAFAKEGYKVTALDPDSSDVVGRGAIAFVKKIENLSEIELFDGYGENLPFKDNSFDVVYVRQGLHHAQNLNTMLAEIYRVLKKGGVVLAVREHVVDNYKESLQNFLNNQIDHQLYGGENAFIIEDYCSAFRLAGFKLKKLWDEYDTIINIYPDSCENLIRRQFENSRLKKILHLFLSQKIITSIFLKRLTRISFPGRLNSFLAKKV